MLLDSTNGDKPLREPNHTARVAFTARELEDAPDSNQQPSGYETALYHWS